MEGLGNPEKDCGIIGNLFQTMVNEMRGSTPLWEDFTYKSMKLHSSLKTTVVAIGAFLEAFQKVADMATGSKGATREIGSALTRLCLRHRSIEAQLKMLTSSVLDNLVAPLQEKLEDWKKAIAQIDKDHAKESKKAKADIKKAASDTFRLKKKVNKGNASAHSKSEMQQKLEIATSEVNGKYKKLEEVEKNSLRQALIEERSRFCLFITCLKPFVDSEVKLLTEISHIDEIMNTLCLQASEPSVLPPSSEQVIRDLKGVDSTAWNPNQSSAGGEDIEDGDCDSTPTTPSDSTPSASSTWNNWPNHPAGAQRPADTTRPHTISSAYERGHARPALKPDMFEPPIEGVEMRPKVNRSNSQSSNSSTGSNRPSATISKMQPVLPPHAAKPKVKHVGPPMLPQTAQPVYANLAELEGKKSANEISDDGEPTTPTTPASLNVTQIQQDTSDELAKAIRELEASTAALNSAYDTDLTPDINQAVNGDSDSYTSKSSGYGTMASTPASSEDAIASGGGPPPVKEEREREKDREMERVEEKVEENVEEKDCMVYPDAVVDNVQYLTLPRPSKPATISRMPSSPKRPTSTSGIPASGTNLTRRNTVHTPKPPPPVRRTASVTGAAPTHVQKLRSPPRQLATDAPDHNQVNNDAPEAQYAELQHIQQSIHAQQPPPPSAKPGPRPPPPVRSDSASTATVIQSLNAKFATLNSQYHDSPDGDVSGGTPRASRPTPPAVKQKPTRSSIPPPPPEISQQQSYQPQQAYHQPQQAYQQPYQQQQQVYQQPQHAYQNQQVYQQPQVYQQQQVYQQPQQMYQQPQMYHSQAPTNHQQEFREDPRPIQHGKSWHGHRSPPMVQGHYQETNTVHAAAVDPDLPPPPTDEELQEVERIYSRPQNVVPSLPSAGQGRRQSQPLPHHSQPGGPQASLLMELKRKVSMDESNA